MGTPIGSSMLFATTTATTDPVRGMSPGPRQALPKNVHNRSNSMLPTPSNKSFTSHDPYHPPSSPTKKTSVSPRKETKKLTSEKVIIESLQAKIKALEARVSVTSDLEIQVEKLKKQLSVMSKSNVVLEKQIDAMTRAHNMTMKTLGAENSELISQLE